MTQLLIQVAGAMVAGGLASIAGSYLGIRVGLAKLQAQFTTWVKAHEAAHGQIDFRIERMESSYFQSRRVNGDAVARRD